MRSVFVWPIKTPNTVSPISIGTARAEIIFSLKTTGGTSKRFSVWKFWTIAAFFSFTTRVDNPWPSSRLKLSIMEEGNPMVSRMIRALLSSLKIIKVEKSSFKMRRASALLSL